MSYNFKKKKFGRTTVILVFNGTTMSQKEKSIVLN